MNQNCPDHYRCCPWKTVALSDHHYGDRLNAYRTIRRYECQDAIQDVIAGWGVALGEDRDALKLLGASGQPEAAAHLLHAVKQPLAQVLAALCKLGFAAELALSAVFIQPEEKPEVVVRAALAAGLISAPDPLPAAHYLAAWLDAEPRRVRQACAKGLSLLAGSPHLRGWEVWPGVSVETLSRLAKMSGPSGSPDAMTRAYAAEALCVLAGDSAIYLAMLHSGTIGAHRPTKRLIPASQLHGAFVGVDCSPEPDPHVRRVWDYWVRVWQQAVVPVNWLPWDGLDLFEIRGSRSGSVAGCER